MEINIGFQKMQNATLNFTMKCVRILKLYEVRSSNPVIGKICIECLLSKLYWKDEHLKDENKEKRWFGAINFF